MASSDHASGRKVESKPRPCRSRLLLNDSLHNTVAKGRQSDSIVADLELNRATVGRVKDASTDALVAGGGRFALVCMVSSAKHDPLRRAPSCETWRIAARAAVVGRKQDVAIERRLGHHRFDAGRLKVSGQTVRVTPEPLFF